MPPLGCQKISPGPASSWMENKSSCLPSTRWSRFLASSMLVQVLVEIFLAEERGAVDALQLRILFLAQPVGAGDVEQLEGLDLSGRRNVRAAAEVDELAGLVKRNLFVGLGELLDEVALHEVAFGLEPLSPSSRGRNSRA